MLAHHRLPVILLASVTVSLFAACGDDSGTTATATPTNNGGNNGAVDNNATNNGAVELPPNWDPPEVWGAPTLVDLNADPTIVEVNLTAGVQSMELFEDYNLDMYLFNGSFPGPMIQAKVGDTVIVHFQNDLPEPTTIHWHGLRISDQMDGNPRIQSPIPSGEGFTYTFVVKEPGAYWYHPHVRANEQVEKGLVGTIIVHDPDHEPAFDAQRYVVLDDMLLDADGFAPFLASHPEVMHGRSGNVLVTNGSPDELDLDIETHSVERWRIVNTANARTMEVSFAGATFRVLGTDGGLLPTPWVTERLTVAVGQRYDVEVTFEAAGEAQLLSHVLVVNDNNQVVEEAFPLVNMHVADGDLQAHTVAMPAGPPVPDRAIDRDEVMTFDAHNTADGGIEWTINGHAHAERPLYIFEEGQTVRFLLRNKLGPEHPFHLHGQFFTIVDNGESFTQQPGLKDTVLVPGLSELEIIASMDNPGRWMAHCHILEHAELGMMGEIRINPAE